MVKRAFVCQGDFIEIGGKNWEVGPLRGLDHWVGGCGNGLEFQVWAGEGDTEFQPASWL